ncbi:hypothetical protein E2F43_11830 [Seongchinamella unica]|uniref:Zinc resistance-associated protein n=1 Tax=Seongchinamella unica TaxID=2547392 RepID=A0A4R5LTS3_9GAMM|nr:Spy/CpxP family protein refolding chaperone [Seongchinamella unica]TDG14157.1 hypothetical protein E2F43_11830 [Seongchinamella unica]
MNQTLSKLIPGTVLMGVLLLSVSAWSMGQSHERDMDRMLSHMTEALNLSEGQQAGIETLLNEVREEGGAERERMNEIRGQLKAMRTDFNAGEAQQLADELGVITSRMAYRMASAQAQVYQQLEPAQQEHFEVLAERREQRSEKRREKHPR